MCAVFGLLLVMELQPPPRFMAFHKLMVRIWRDRETLKKKESAGSQMPGLRFHSE